MFKQIEVDPSGIQLYESKHHAGDRIAEHHHEIYQLIYALEGTGQIIVDGEAYRLEHDQLTFITPYTDHAVIADDKLTVLVLAFDQRVIDATNRSLFEHSLYESKFVGFNPFTSGEVRQLLRTILYEQSHQSTYQQNAMSIYLSQLLLLIARGERNQESSNANSLRADKLREYIDSHYYEALDAENLAGKLGVSTRHMNTIFKETFDQTPMQYLAEVRVGLSKKMLLETDKDIASICFEVGFESISTFYRAFKHHTAISPHKFRTNKKIDF
ncbi:AraC family transcriptional regulator [Gracilibacillus alcaliphilus]|uniref:AraC family transcriptional regulator n=1 Tax=Gracilibacillus alcaliphilus TaxID=1401441 RepID=UPI00195E04EC|nr:AraC family transcriptional regulator [Gracilibacillus alcaliphilus]MBM7676406.1 AraC-like DNA-binding protein [Gracilibacillus alcaliphilus]